jgi:uncharacterized protein (DUF1501 family)
MKKLNRREFLRKSSAAAATAAFAHYPGMAFSQGVGVSAPFSDYKAMVCLFMFGGNDSYNMLVPRSNAEYNAYAASRQNLALLQGDLLPINPLTQDGAQYGLHPSMTGVQTLFEQGRAAIVANMGPLVQPTTRDQYFNQSVALPPQLFSHNDQQDQWHSLKGATVSNTGWAGRIADLIRMNVANQQLATNVSLFGSSLFQSADETVAYVMGNAGPDPFAGFARPEDLNDPTLTDEERALIQIFIEQRNAFENVINAPYDTIYERGFAEVQRRAVDTIDLVRDALDDPGRQPVTTAFPQSQLGTQLRTVAEMIAARDSLQMERQIFFVATGGFDTHDDQVQLQPGLLGGISDAVKAFYDATIELGVSESVTTFTMSDFGRTLTSNGDGSDHGWGGHSLIIGDGVAGRDIYGTYPDLTLGSNDDVGGGRMIPTTSADQYAATLSRWFGVEEMDIPMVAPNIGNFGIQDLGFFI